jgi:hypothetical protein
VGLLHRLIFFAGHFAMHGEWLLKAVFTCNHLRTPVREGKCFCPDCGRGVVFQWIVLRCRECRTRRESRYFLRQVVPSHACCMQCGTENFRYEYLDMNRDESYFQLDKARILIQEADDYVARRFSWSTTATAFNDTLQQTLWQTRVWLDPVGQARWQPVWLLPGA